MEHESPRSDGGSILSASTVACFAFPLLAILFGLTTYPHYGAVGLVPAGLVLAWGASRLESRLTAGWRGVLRGFAVLGLALQLWTTLAFMTQVHRSGGTQGEYGTTLNAKRIEVLKYEKAGLELPEAAPLEHCYLLDQLRAGSSQSD
ncbi:hypothetical protein HQ520_02010 [bacterium]|nr:hypothetical protein [bacterium]